MDDQVLLASEVRLYAFVLLRISVDDKYHFQGLILLIEHTFDTLRKWSVALHRIRTDDDGDLHYRTISNAANRGFVPQYEVGFS